MSNKINNLYQFENFKLNTRKKTLLYENENVDLPLKAIEVLCVLVENPGQLITKEEIFNNVWKDSFVEDNVLGQNIYLLRKTFDKYGVDKDLIKNVPRRGYRFLGDVNEIIEETILEKETFEREIYLQQDVASEKDLNVSVVENPTKTKSLFSSKSILFYSTILLTFSFVGFSSWFFVFPYFEGLVFDKDRDAKRLEYDRITESGRDFHIGLSPDDQNAVYVSHTKDGLYMVTMQHLPTKSETVIIPPQEAKPHCLTFSPDGHYLYYSTRDETNTNTVFRVPIYGGRTETVVKGLSSFFSISPDGSQITYLEYDAEKDKTDLIISNSLDGSGKRIVKTLQGNQTFAIWGVKPAWKPDGTKLAIIVFTKEKGLKKGKSRSELAEVDIADGTINPIKTPKWRHFGNPQWQADGKGLYLIVREKVRKPKQIWHLEYLTGKARNITNDTNQYTDYRVASDESFLLTTTLAESQNLYLMSLDDTTNTKQLTFETGIRNGVFGLNWSSDGKHIFYVRTKNGLANDLWKINVETLEKQQLTFDEPAWINRIDVTPNGKSVVFASNRTGKQNIWRIDLDGKNLRQITNGVDEAIPVISPDGKWLYYLSFGENTKALWKRELDGKGKPILIQKNVVGGSVISPTNPKKIASNYFDANEKEKHPWINILFDEDNPKNWKKLEIGQPKDWAADGSGVYYLDGGQSFNNVWFISTETFEKKQITHFKDLRILDLDISPDGKKAVLSRGATTGSIIKVSGF